MRYSEPGAAPARILLDAEQELRAHEQGLEGDLNAAVEAAGFAVRRRDRTRANGATSSSPTGRRYARRTTLARIVLAQLSASAVGVACSAAGRQTKMRSRLAVCPGPVRLVRPADLDVTQVRPVAAFRDVEAARERPEEWLAFAGRNRGGLVEERRRSLHAVPRTRARARTSSSSARLRACCSSRGDAPVHAAAEIVGVLRAQRQRAGGIEREGRDALAVDADLEDLRLRVDRHTLVQVARERGRDARTRRPAGTCSRCAGRRACRTACPGSRRSCERSSGTRNESIVDERRSRADSEAADLVGRTQISLEQRRRQLQHAADVVESVARVVTGQQARDVDVHGEQVAHGVVVLAAVQAVKRHRAARIRRLCRRAIELARRARPRAPRSLPVAAAGRRRAAASCRSRACGRRAPRSPACAPTSARSRDSSDRSAVRSASSWHSKQYRASVARCSAAISWRDGPQPVTANAMGNSSKTAGFATLVSRGGVTRSTNALAMPSPEKTQR